MNVLVANRGEIARRILATCRRRGIATVAVFADPDADSPHVREAGCAVRLPGSAAGDTYLRGDLIVAAARRSGADAVHPGYGFLSENAGFARAVRDAGLLWIGPDPDTIALMGSKIESKRRMAVAGVPVLDRLDVASLTETDLPVLVKASAGGGGRGMRIVRRLADLPDALAYAAAEAASAFGDPTVFCERYLADGHHVEVQILADTHGTVWALGERECSLQRRHQKLIEETPSPLIDRLGPAVRERLLAAGRDAAAAVGYRGAGTVEFLADAHGAFWFLEMNTRLQVEHPVTEAVHGVDLVGLQLDIAAGAALGPREPQPSGHAIEARLYAEIPADDWRPGTGMVARFTVPGVDTRFTASPVGGIRLDAGVEAGSVVGTFYDGLLAKVVAHAPVREAAARHLAATLRGARIHGVPSNRDLLAGSLLHPDFLAGTAGTGFYDRHPPASLEAAGLDPWLGALVAALADAESERGPLLPQVRSGFRNSPVGHQVRRYGEVEIRYRYGREGLDLPDPRFAGVRLVSAAPDLVVLEIDGVRRRWTVGRFDDRVVVDGADGSVELVRAPRFADPGAAAPAGTLLAPLPGTVTRVAVAAGDRVTAGTPLLWLEAMKMEHPVHAPADGTVTAVAVTVGDQVAQGVPLAVIGDGGA